MLPENIVVRAYFCTMNRYIVLDHIGRGSFGDVYLAIRKDTGEKVRSVAPCANDDVSAVFICGGRRASPKFIYIKLLAQAAQLILVCCFVTR